MGTGPEQEVERRTRKTAEAPGPAFSSNAVRLSPREWLIAGGTVVALFLLVPRAWQAIEPLDAGPDYRVPYKLGEDYSLYQRYCRKVCAEDATPIVGDSVVWGHYVAGNETLSHYVNELSAGTHYANLGLDGSHPAALAGLVDTYASDIRARRVVLFCNPLWMTSPDRDLRGKTERFNHPRLVPQFVPRIPCYKEPLEARLGIVVQRRLPFQNWVQHMRTAYFDGDDLASWTMNRPYENPAGPITLRLPDSEPSPVEGPKPWFEGGFESFNAPWIELETSIQWESFCRTIALLRDRGNQVFVLVGPFNEHMLKPASLSKYQDMKARIGNWLSKHEVPHYIPGPLPSDHYADASHPLAKGYALLARRLWESPAFAAFRPKD
jgi:hypothetical protein